MEKDSHDPILKSVVDFYFASSDFNGYPVYRLKAEHGFSDSEVSKLLPALVSTGRVDVMCGNVHPNAHIKAFSTISVDDQLRFLAELDLNDHFCLYPTRTVLATCSDVQAYEGSPYSKELALGAGQLDFRAFDLSVLEYYRNDPRYSYRTDWINGRISIRDEFFETGSMLEHDQILLQTFGFAYDDDLNRAVAAFVRYLHNLSPEHQRIWAAKELRGTYKLHPDYYRNSILGDFGTRISIFEAFVQELSVINEMAALMGRAAVFRETFKEKEPKEFGFLLRPTLSEFNRFAHLLDKMMSDNLSKEFFRDDIPVEEEEERADGRIVVR
ncbi:MAG: AAA family ATPase, partial [Bacteroidota bacterium]